MNKQSHIVFTALVGLYLALHFAQHNSLGPDWLRFYGKDLLMVPVLLLAVQIVCTEIERPFKMSIGTIALSVMYVSLVFEVFIPWLRPNANGDWTDVLAYVAGGVLYALLIKNVHKPNWKRMAQSDNKTSLKT